MSLPKLDPAHLYRALALLTRLPGPKPQVPLAEAAWAFPIVGLIVAVPQIIGAWIALWIGLSPAIAALIAITLGIATTGALHEDGLADSADGLGAWNRERRLEIMRDSHIGSFGTLAMLLSTGFRWAALSALFAAGWIAAPLLIAASSSRAAMGFVMTILPPARPDGLGHGAGRPEATIPLTGAALAAALAALIGGGAFAPILLAITATTTAIIITARARLGGQTGDILGATQICAEIAALLALVTAL